MRSGYWEASALCTAVTVITLEGIQHHNVVGEGRSRRGTNCVWGGIRTSGSLFPKDYLKFLLPLKFNE